jgi:opacity protein-like surface antigen
MSLKKIAVAVVFGAAAMTMSASVLAQKRSETGWYVTGSIGQNDDFNDETTWRIAAGYQLDRNLSVELGYINLGEVSLPFGASAEASAFELIGLYKYPVANRFSIYGLAGLARIKSEVTAPAITIPGLGTVGGGSSSDSSIELTYGFGVQYDFAPNFGVRAQWQDYDGAAVLSAGIVYKF